MGESCRAKATLCHRRSHPSTATRAENGTGSLRAAAGQRAGCAEAAQRSLPQQSSSNRQPLRFSVVYQVCEAVEPALNQS